AISRAGGSIPGPWRAEKLPRRNRSLEHARRARCIFDPDSGEGAGFMKNLRPVPNRYMGERARAFKANHARPNAAHGKSDAGQVLPAIGTIIRPSPFPACRTGGLVLHGAIPAAGWLLRGASSAQATYSSDGNCGALQKLPPRYGWVVFGIFTH